MEPSNHITQFLQASAKCNFDRGYFIDLYMSTTSKIPWFGFLN